MKKVRMFLMIAFISTMYAFGQKIESRTVSNFTGIDASDRFEITVVKGSSDALTIEADDEILPYVRSDVRNGVLHLYLEDDARSSWWPISLFKKDVKKDIKILKAFVIMKELDNVSLSGACKLYANDFFYSDIFKCNCSGASRMAVNVNADQMNIEASSTSKVQMKAYVTGNTKINALGASDVQVELQAGNLEINTSSTSKVVLIGSTTGDFIRINVSGASNLKIDEFSVKTASIVASSTSKIQMKGNITGDTNINTTGAANILGELITNNITISTSSTSIVDLVGSATGDYMRVDATGASNFKIGYFTVKTANITASSTSKIQINNGNVADDIQINASGASHILGGLRANKVKINANSTSKVDLIGSAADLMMDVSGASRCFNTGDFMVKTATVIATSTSKSTINVTDNMDINLSGAASVNYKGAPTMTISTSGTAKIRKI